MIGTSTFTIETLGDGRVLLASLIVQILVFVVGLPYSFFGGGGTVGGPIIRDKMHFFYSLDRIVGDSARAPSICGTRERMLGIGWIATSSIASIVRSSVNSGSRASSS